MFDVMESDKGLVKAWIRGVPVEEGARKQLLNVASLPFILKWVAAMPDVHWGMGATIGSVIPTEGAIVPAAAGVDLGCGMQAVRTSLRAFDLPGDLSQIRTMIEQAVPHGRTHNEGKGDVGAWGRVPNAVGNAWENLGIENGNKA